MKTYLIDNLPILQHHLTLNYQFHQIVKNHDGQFHWQHINSEEINPLVHDKPQSSAKSYFFADQENVLIFNGEYFQETLPTPKPFVLFGMQSCDLTAIHYQDQFFKDDPYYQGRRQQSLLVGLDCIAPCDNGFCKTVNAGPGVSADCADLVLHPLKNNQWLLIEQTNKGADAIKGLKLKKADSNCVTERNYTLSECEQLFPDDNYLTQGIKKLNSGKISDTFWQKVAIQCLGCSGCTTLCPTCSCYDTRTIKQDNNNISQQRYWDSCLYEGFQREASFNNPSLEAGSRVKRFWHHKFGDDFFTDFSRYGCVGCGRCEQTCPGVIGVHSVMKHIEQEN
jgi:ferredoxin|tara:strand:+ start:1874 stop:2884 length:1011 start_codon:yes stop_codon:yes gene_type:complete